MTTCRPLFGLPFGAKIVTGTALHNLHLNMKFPSPDITKALLAELKALSERHAQFQKRVKAANETALARDQEARKQNVILTERIIGLERELKQAKESIEVYSISVYLWKTRR